MSRPRVFFDVTIDDKPMGRIIMEVNRLNDAKYLTGVITVIHVVYCPCGHLFITVYFVFVYNKHYVSLGCYKLQPGLKC